MTLERALRQDKNVFFLHLLGLDTTGHAYRPYSREYLHNIKIVDEGVKEITKLIEDFYGDGKTAFIFTADHGISDWGSHGDGHPDNTRTPLVAWGSGIAKPTTSPSGISPGHEDGFSADWGLNHVQRHDVEQADVAALMAYLAGLDFPANSVGQLPLTYVKGDAQEKAKAALANARGILEMYHVKEEQKKLKELRYKAFNPFKGEGGQVERRLRLIEQDIEQGQYELAIEKSQALLNLGLDGLRYLQTYDWLFLRLLVTTGYLGWIAFAMTTVIDMHVLHGKTQTSRTFATFTFFGAVLAMIVSLLFVRKAPVTYYAYAMFPPFFWEGVVARREALLLGGKALFGHIDFRKDGVKLGLNLIAFLGFLELLVRLMSIPLQFLLKLGLGLIVLSSCSLYCLLPSSLIVAYALRSGICQEQKITCSDLDSRMFVDEQLHTSAGYQDRKHQRNVGLDTFAIPVSFILILSYDHLCIGD